VTGTVSTKAAVGATKRAEARPALPARREKVPAKKSAVSARGAKAATKEPSTPARGSKPAVGRRAASSKNATLSGRMRPAGKAGVVLRAKPLRAAVAKREKPKKAEAKVALERRKAPLLRAEADLPFVGGEGLTEEDVIRSAKYTPREAGDRVFEEERFIFPESYRVNRIRLLVKDPEWLFAYWDVDPEALDEVKQAIGERAMSLSRLTLRITDPRQGGGTDILLPPGARWWYVRADTSRRSYRAELGILLPSGRFRRLALSNTVATPRVGPSSVRASRRVSYDQMPDWTADDARAIREAEIESVATSSGPLSSDHHDGAGRRPNGEATTSLAERGGASDTFRPGGASETFRR
jgi:hypothetical protein